MKPPTAHCSTPPQTDPEVTAFPNVSQSKVTYSVSSSYHLTPDRMLYARIATGYRPGGANKIVPDGDTPPTFGPDTTTNYEIGIKSEWLERRLLFNLTAFYIDWKDTQVTGGHPAESHVYLQRRCRSQQGHSSWRATSRPVRGLNIGLNVELHRFISDGRCPRAGWRRPATRYRAPRSSAVR